MDDLWLKSQFSLHPGLSKTDLAKALGLDPPAVSKMLAGSRQVKAQEYVAMRKFFGLPVEGQRAERRDTGAAAYRLRPFAEPPGYEEADAWAMPAHVMARRTRTAPEQIRVFDVGDATMAPDFQPGEHVLVDLTDCRPSPPGVFLVFDGVGHSLRQVEIVPHSDPVTVRLSPLNPTYAVHVATLDRAGLAGRVIAKLQWL